MNLRELALLTGAMARLARDSARIDDLHIIAEIISRRRYAALLDAALREDSPLLRERPEIDHESVDFEALRALPADSLGGAYVRHLERHGLELYLDPTSTRVIRDPDVGYLIHRYRQVHDIWHVLLDLGVAGHEEVLLHAFVLGQLGLPNSALIVSLGGIKHLVLEGRWDALRRGLISAYRMGKRASPLLLVRWEDHWAEPLDAVRARYGVAPLITA
ncbi:hypothetical protein G6O69_20290 [Pseudenhygromyxa sp. WMMC2535]|uniref:Coq4 family protein n=1 Tax=Pseudenhygromyxa sp. WMMC2535 TaxID=2712867 RepID=UPI001555218D|nr:hypothetical protein [Pseudenhygromyxa sp. WMMC2535]